MLFRQLFDLNSCTYSYLLADIKSNESLLIDPVNTCTESYLSLISELGLRLIATIDTHTHADHITGSSILMHKTGCDIIQGAESEAKGVSRKVHDGDDILFGDYRLTAIHTPGHTQDCYSFYFNHNDDRRVFTGDTLLIRGTGRIDFQQGNAREQYQSLFNKLLTLPDDTAVYPGHDYKGWTVSSIKEEKRHNPRLQLKSIDEYEALMNNLKLPKPKLIDIAVPANLCCGATTEG